MDRPTPPTLTLPEEPIPAFTHRIHNHTGICSKGHTFSGDRLGLQMAAFFKELDKKCPHCEREKWAAERDRAKADHAQAIRAYEADLQEYEALQAAGNAWGMF